LLQPKAELLSGHLARRRSRQAVRALAVKLSEC